jgi:predicted ATPase/class 3 adenylate cyclase
VPLTFFFSDIEGSTRLIQTMGDAYTSLLERHRQIVRDAFARSHGNEVGTEGDSFFAVFSSAKDAVTAAVDIQRAIGAEAWPGSITPKVRIGLHTGEAQLIGGDYVGLDVHRAARIMASGHGGQILVSGATQGLVGAELGEGVRLSDLGEHRLRDLSAPERLFQVLATDIEADFPRLRTLDVVANNLPTQSAPLIGRGEDLGQIRDRLEAHAVRLLTLIGPGGIGKTRLALQAAANQVDRFRDGVFFVDLSAARDSEAALQTIVQAIDIPVAVDAGLRAALVEQLRTRQMLLLLDNFEQVIPAADDVAELMRAAPELKVLITSREALRIRGEQLFPVAPLSLPDDAAGDLSAEELSRFEAIRLFVARAQESQPTFHLTDDNAAAVARICARLDGLPLAIELAAARLRLFSPAELLERLGGRLELLRGGARDLPARQRTLRSTIEWSHELLDDEERAVFQLLSLFSSARVEAVEEVWARTERMPAVDVVDRLESLVDKSLVRSVDDGGGRRLSMLETIGEFAAEQLVADPDVAAAARRAFADYFVDFAQSRLRAARGAGGEAALGELAVETGNLRTAWRNLVDAGDLPGLNRLLDALWLLHDHRGWYHGAAGLANDVLGVLSRVDPSRARADDAITMRMTLARAMLALRGYTGQVEDLYREALDIAETAGAVPRRMSVLRNLASFHLYRAEIDKTAAMGRQMLELAEQEQDVGMQVEGHVILGPATAFLGDIRAGLDHLDRATALFDPELHGRGHLRLGPNPGVAAGAVAGLLYWLYGMPDTAADRAAGALRLAAEINHPYSLTYATFHVALLDLWSGRVVAAHDHAAEVLRLAAEHEYPIWRAIGMVIHGLTTAAVGDPDAGLASTEQGIALYEDLKTPPVFWPQLLSLRAHACAMAGRPAEALEIIDQAAAIAGERTWDSAELKIQRADLLVAAGDTAAAESWLMPAVEEAHVTGGRMLELQAATRLARLAEPPSAAAIARLRSILAELREGADNPDLQAARSLLA